MDGAASERPSNLTRQTLSGMKWTYFQTAVSAFLQIAVTGVLARLLTPEAFGLVALADLTLRFVNYLARGGVGQAIVQKPGLEPLHVRAGATASVILGACFSSLVWLGAPLAAEVLGDPDVTPVLRWMSLSLLLHGFGATAEALLSRDLRFRALAGRSIVSYVLGYPIVGLVLAARGAGVWALVAASLVQTGSRSLLAYLAHRHSLRPTFDRQAHGSLLSFGSRVSLISFFEFLGSELDTFAVGRFAGASALGLYNRAYVLVRLPVYHLTTSFSKVLFPAFSSVQRDVARFRGAYVSAAGLTAAIVFPTAAGIAVAGPEIVRVVLGPRWTDAIPVLPWIAVASALAMVTHIAAVSTEARAELNAKIGISITKVVILFGLLVLAAGGPLWGYGAALAGAALYAHVAYVWLVCRTLEAPVRSVIDRYPGALIAAGSVAGGIAAARWALFAIGTPVVVVLLVEIAVGAAILLAHLRFGVLGAVRRDLTLRLRRAGMMGTAARAPLSRCLRAVLGPPAEDGTAAAPDRKATPR